MLYLKHSNGPYSISSPLELPSKIHESFGKNRRVVNKKYDWCTGFWHHVTWQTHKQNNGMQRTWQKYGCSSCLEYIYKIKMCW